MDTAQAVNRLQSLAADRTKRSKTAVLREVFIEIETAVHAGVSQVVILAELRALGLEMSEHAFRSAIRRLRAEHAGTGRRRVAPMPTDFSTTPFAEGTSFRATTSSGSLYDVEALSRLIRASRSGDTVLAV